MEEEKLDTLGCLRKIDHHVSPHKVGSMIGDNAEQRITVRFELVRNRTASVIGQVEKIKSLAEKNGYKDVIAILDEKI